MCKRTYSPQIGQESVWERPFTAKRYVHPPLSERLITMWPSFMVMLSDVVEGTHNYYSSAFRLLVGEQDAEIPFEKTEMVVREDGIPIHTLAIDLENCRLEMECFSNITRKSTAFCRVTVKNTTDTSIAQELSLLLRSGKETLLTCNEVDGYCHYNQNVRTWGFLRSNWKYENGVAADGDYTLHLQADNFQPVWRGDANGLVWHRRHLIKLKTTLKVGEQKSFDLCFDKGEVQAFDYDTERAKTKAFWQGELSKIKVRVKDAVLQNNFTAQMLQMFAYPVGKNCVWPRQGGLQRPVWPAEAHEFLIALDRTGDFFSYTEQAYKTFFDVMQAKAGEDKGAVLNFSGQMWASNTGASVWGLSRHLMYRNDKQKFLQFREQLLLAYNWMQQKRASSAMYEGAVQGVFPPMKACDWPGEYQSWCWTDGNNLMGYQWLADVFEYFQDEKAAEIRTSYNNYLATMQDVLQNVAVVDEILNEVHITNRLGFPFVDPQVGAMCDSAINLLRAKVIEPNSKIAHLLENYYRNRGYGQKGLMGLMCDGLIEQGHNADYWAGHTYYTNQSDICWFYTWLEQGETEKAKQTLDAQLTYSTTPEYYMCERYADNDPFFTPWLPNASAMGRTIMMLLDIEEYE